MRIGVGLPRSTAEIGLSGVINLLKADSWLGIKADGRVAERIASDWQWDEARTMLRLKLRPDVYFHDGTLMTPQVAAETLRASITSSTSAYSLKSIGAIRGEGADTVSITLKERNAFIVPDLAGMLVTKPGAPDVGTGPFRVVDRNATPAKLAAFPKYYRGRPALAGIELSGYPTQRNAWTALMRGEIDMLYEVSRDAADFVQAESTVKSYTFFRPYYIPLVFNVRTPALKDPRVRQAINMAIDRATLVREGMSGRGSIADGPIPPQHWAYSPPAVPFTFSPAEARRLLDEAHYPARATALAPLPVRFSFTCLVYANDSRYERLEVLVQKQLAEVGIEMRLEPLPITEFAKRLADGNFDAFLFELAGRSLGWVYEFWHSVPKTRFDSGYRAADGALDRLKAAFTDDETRAAVAEVQRVLHDDPPAAFLVWQEQTRAVSAKFDVSVEDKRDPLINLWQWRAAEAK
jgi:peptide/nickel transport system substrate-binding protein